MGRVSLTHGHPQDPKTPAEWQEAVDCAHVAMTLHAAKLYGLVEGGPVVVVERCAEILRRGQEFKILPRPDAVDRFLEAMKQAMRVIGGGR